MTEEIIINGVDVNDCDLYCSRGYCMDDNISPVDCKDRPDCEYKQLKHLQEENEKIKKQYNCYACGNCRGTEDYINLEKHHKGLRKQFDEVVKRNNTLSLRIEELEKENEELKEKNKELLNLCNNGGALLVTESAKTKKYKQALEDIRKWTTNHNPCDIEADINCTKEDCFECLNYDIKKITEIINEVFNDN